MRLNEGGGEAFSSITLCNVGFIEHIRRRVFDAHQLCGHGRGRRAHQHRVWGTWEQ
jgi:hypothetical protein